MRAALSRLIHRGKTERTADVRDQAHWDRYLQAQYMAGVARGGDWQVW